ncbi:MAG: hypothetical protein HQK83_20515 [Fibrobacteria bacterium]|nr:hypothetical protein [Fibrobacteria bacterium]
MFKKIVVVLFLCLGCLPFWACDDNTTEPEQVTIETWRDRKRFENCKTPGSG